MIYLLHFERAIGDLENARGQAQHYVGWADDVGARLAAHRAGRGAAITAYLVDPGIGWRLVRLWLGGRDLERRIKRRKEGPALCPVCNPDGWALLAQYPGSVSWRPGGGERVDVELPIAVEFGPAPVPAMLPACPF